MDWKTFTNSLTNRDVGLTFILGGCLIGLVSSLSKPTRSVRARDRLMDRFHFKSETKGKPIDLVSELVDNNFLEWALMTDPAELHAIIIHYEDLDNGEVLVYVDEEDSPRLDDLLMSYKEELMQSLDDDDWVPDMGWDDHLGWTYAADWVDYYPGTDIPIWGKTGNSEAWFKEMSPWHFPDNMLSPEQVARKEAYLFNDMMENRQIRAVTAQYMDPSIREAIPELRIQAQHLSDEEALLIALMEEVEASHPYPELLEKDPVWQELNDLIQENLDDLIELGVLLDELTHDLDYGPGDDSHVWTMAAESQRFVKARGRHSIRDLFLGYFVPMQTRYGQEVAKEMREYYETGRVGIHDDEDNKFWQPSDRAPQGEYSGLNRWQARPVAQAVAYAQMADKGYLVPEGE
jgi:hypothetical protein